jgi:hypothetical protein
MALETLFAKITHEAAPNPRREKSWLPVCCICGLLRDETSKSLDDARWVTQRSYQKIHGVNPADCLYTHTYCPKCFMRVRERMRSV